MPRPFLTARWTNLCLISYHVPRTMLEAHLLRGLELDVPPGTPADMGVASLVAFDFLDTRVRGVRWPRHVNFPEINLRFYATMKGAPGETDRRGVVFVREYVPRQLISFVARTLYNEPYAAATMSSRVTVSDDRMVVEHRLTPPRGRPSTITITGAREATVPGQDTLDHWFKEHQWGFGRSRAGVPLVYEVRHPVWAVHAVEKYDLAFDWVGAYGREWDFLGRTEPISVVLAQGSSIEVHPKRVLKGPTTPAAS